MDCRSPLGYWPVVFIIWFLKVKTSSHATEVNAWGKQKILNIPQRREVFSFGEDKFWEPVSQANFTLNQPDKVLRHLPWLLVPPGSELAAESPLSFPVTEEIPLCLAGSILRRDPTCGGAALQSTIWVICPWQAIAQRPDISPADFYEKRKRLSGRKQTNERMRGQIFTAEV